MDHSAGDDAEGATGDLLTLLLDDLGPALQWYRDEVARRLGLSPAELLCLDLCRRHGPISSGRIGMQLGLTRSAVAKLVRRLEDAGHVVRELPGADEQEIQVRLRPHPARDETLAALRESMWGSVRALVERDEQRHAVVARALVALSEVTFRHARALQEAAVTRRLRAERRARREAEQAPPWWAR